MGFERSMDLTAEKQKKKEKEKKKIFSPYSESLTRFTIILNKKFVFGLPNGYFLFEKKKFLHIIFFQQF